MSQYTPEQLAEILALHSKWRMGDAAGQHADLYGANLRGANLYGANLYGADLYGADLSGANLRGADLSGANLRGANLRGANLRGAYLYGADLSGAYLYGANLRGADLYGANLRGANLRGANLRGADLYGADHILRGPCLDGYEVFLVRWSDGPRYKAGCRWFTVQEAQEHWRDLSRHDRTDAKRHCELMLTGLAALLEIAHLLGWEGCEP